jgi:hypothetical protein
MKQVAKNATVVRDYARYRWIQTTSKWVDSPQFTLKAVPNHRGNEGGDVNVTFVNEEETGRLNVEFNVERTKSFKFRLFCDAFMDAPCYRFDSDGGTHENPTDETTPFRQRMVPAPHFHLFDMQGRNIAYRPEELCQNEQALLSDAREALKCFCREEHIQLSADPVFAQETLSWGTNAHEDNQEGVDFP